MVLAQSRSLFLGVTHFLSGVIFFGIGTVEVFVLGFDEAHCGHQRCLADLGSETTLFPIHVAKRLWKKPVTLALHLELHYDAVVKQDRVLGPVFDSAAVLSCEHCQEFWACKLSFPC